ncbi:LuxR family transcriptional regulator [Actinocorallia populi]|uniref:LuxR family transcriptional regulator n=1 Tax=Actinocorallia populi TaxID=2079200 RepID=UPI000D08A231|nr:LuxR family transcriptional regulator [Actinocorallia populi]
MSHGWDTARERIEELLDAAGRGAGSALVLRGGPGTGKTALLERAAARNVRAVRAHGVEFEPELPFTGLGRLVLPVRDRLGGLPAPPRRALEKALGRTVGEQRSSLVTAVLALLAELAEDEPLLCLVDDAQWLDQASAEVLLRVARGLVTEGVVLLFAVREGALAGHGLPELRLEEPVSHGGHAFREKAAGLPEAAREMLLIAAVEATGNLDVVVRAAGAEEDVLAPAVEAGLIEITTGEVRFPRPSVRAAVHEEASPERRAAAHRALAGVLDGPENADRRAWHRAAAATEPAEELAIGLEDVAERARNRDGHWAASLAYARAAELSETEPGRARRLLLAAERALAAGRPERAAEQAEAAARLRSDPRFRTRAAWAEGRARHRLGDFRTAYERCTEFAGQGSVPPDRMLVHAFHSAWHLDEPELRAVAGRLEPLEDPVAEQQANITGKRIPAFADSLVEGEPLGLIRMCGPALTAGYDLPVREAMTRATDQLCARDPIGPPAASFFFLAVAEFFLGRHLDAAAILEDAPRVARDAGDPLWSSRILSVRAVLAAVEGREKECRELVEGARDASAPGSTAAGQAWTYWALGLLELGLGRAEAALEHLAVLQEKPFAHHVCAVRSIPDLVEAAVRAGSPETAARPYTAFVRWRERYYVPWAWPLVHRCGALMTGEGKYYAGALVPQARPFERARTELLYGEWLCGEGREAQGGEHLGRALETFEGVRAAPWSARARTALESAGLAVPRPELPPAALLAPRELRVCRMAARGLSDRDIAVRLLLSPRTVARHLYRAYPKLAVSGRGGLASLDL